MPIHHSPTTPADGPPHESSPPGFTADAARTPAKPATAAMRKKRSDRHGRADVTTTTSPESAALQPDEVVSEIAVRPAPAESHPSETDTSVIGDFQNDNLGAKLTFAGGALVVMIVLRLLGW